MSAFFFAIVLQCEAGTKTERDADIVQAKKSSKKFNFAKNQWGKKVKIKNNFDCPLPLPLSRLSHCLETWLAFSQGEAKVEKEEEGEAAHRKKTMAN